MWHERDRCGAREAGALRENLRWCKRGRRRARVVAELQWKKKASSLGENGAHTYGERLIMAILVLKPIMHTLGI